MPTFDRSKPGKRRHRKGKLTVKKLAKQVKSMMPKPEWKIVDTVVGGGIILNTASVISLVPVSQGTTDLTRIGNKITVRSFLLRLSIVPNAVQGYNFLRAILVRDKQPNGVLLTIAQLLQTGAGGYQSAINDNNGTRFKVLFDRTYTVDVDANGAQVDKQFKKLKFVVNYPDTATTPTTNDLVFVLISDAGVNGPTVVGNVRVRYTDM